MSPEQAARAQLNEIMSNRDAASEQLNEAEKCAVDAPSNQYGHVLATIAIGRALLDVADAVREQTATVLAEMASE